MDEVDLPPDCLALLEYLADRFGRQDLRGAPVTIPKDAAHFLEMLERGYIKSYDKNPTLGITEAGRALVKEIRMRRAQPSTRAPSPGLESPLSDPVAPGKAVDAPPPEPSLPPSAVRAYQRYEAAIKRNPELETKTDREVYKYIQKNLLEPGDEMETVETFIRYVRIARSARGQQKHLPKHGRKGRSTPRRDEV